MLLFDWLITMRRLCTGQTPPRNKRFFPRRRRRPAPQWWAAEVLEDRTLLSAVTGIDAGDRIDQATDTGLGTTTGTFVCDESIDNDGTDIADVDLFRIETSVGDTLVARTESQPNSDDIVNTLLRLFDADGNQVAFDDDSGPGLYSELTYTFDAGGTYFVGVTAFPELFYDPNVSDGTGLFNNGTEPFDGDEGDYRLTLTIDSGDTQAEARETGIGPAGGTFNSVESLGGGPSGNRDVDLFRFEAAAGHFLVAETSNPSPSAGGVDTVLRLFDDNGNEIAVNNDNPFSANGESSRLVFQFNTSGTYFIGVSGNPNTVYNSQTGADTVDGDLGDYRLRIELSANAPNGEIQGTRFDDQNANGIRDSGEAGLAGLTVFLDVNGNGILDLTRDTFNSSNVPVAIQDFTTIFSQIDVNGLSGVLTDVNLTLDITHTYDSDLSVFLIAPSGTRVELFTGVGDDVQNFTNTTFDDQAALSITAGNAPFTGTFRPEGIFADFNAEDPNGIWQLEISDVFSGDTGTLNSWSLTILTDQASPTEPFTVTDADGNYAFTGLPPGTFTVGQVLPPGSVQTFPDTTPLELFRADFTGIGGGPDTDGFTSSGFFDQWHVTAERGNDAGHSAGGSYYFGDEFAFFGPEYANNADGTLTSPTIDLTAFSGEQIFLEFNHFLDIEADFDFASVAIVSGSVRTVIADNDFIGGFPSFTSGFEAVTLDISQFAGQQVQVEFSLTSDSIVAFEGWYVDDVVVRTEPQPGLHQVIVEAGQLVSGIDFGSTIPTTGIRGTKFNDLNRDGVRNLGEPGVEGTIIFLDENGNGILDTLPETFNSPDVPVAIQDVTTVFSQLDVNGLSGAITDVNLTLDITHTFDSDLTVFLIGPSGTRVQLFSGVGGFNENFTSTTLDDQAAQSITAGNAPFTGTFRPEGILADLNGENPNGIWQLEISDAFFGDTGTLNSWSLAILTDQFSPIEPFTVTDADGNYAFTGLLPGTFTVAEVLPPGVVQTFPEDASFEFFRADFSDNGAGPDTDGFTSSGFFDQWNVTTERGNDAGHSAGGSYYFGDEFAPFGPEYANDADGALISPTIDLTAFVGQQIFLEFNHFLAIEEFFDIASVAIVSGNVTTVIADNHVIGGFRSFTSGFEAVTLDISQFAGRQVQVEFSLVSDSIVQEEGWYIDDVVVRPGPQPGVHRVTVAAEEVVTGIDFGSVNLTAEIRGTKFNDINGDGVRDPGELGVEGIILFLDENGNGVFDLSGTPLPLTFNSQNVPVGIQDLTTVLSQLEVNGLNGTIADVDLTIDITHTFDSDLIVFLIAPSGTRVELFTEVGDDGENFINTTLDDQAAQSIITGSAPFTGTFRPEGILADLNGEDPNGLWQLEISDTFFADEDTLNSWSLTIVTDQPSPAEPFTVTDADGNYAFTGLPQGTFTVREVLPPGSGQTFPGPGPLLLPGFHQVTIGAGEIITGIDFGNQELGEIRGTRFNDLNDDGVRDPGEPGIEGVRIFLDLNNNEVLTRKASPSPSPMQTATTR